MTFNLSELLEFWKNDQDVILDFLDNFEAEIKIIETQVEQSLQHSNWTDLIKLSHRLRGFIANLRWPELDARGLEFKYAIEQNKLSDCLDVFQDLQKMTAQVVQMIKEHQK